MAKWWKKPPHFSLAPPPPLEKLKIFRSRLRRSRFKRFLALWPTLLLLVQNHRLCLLLCVVSDYHCSWLTALGRNRLASFEDAFHWATQCTDVRHTKREFQINASNELSIHTHVLSTMYVRPKSVLDGAASYCSRCLKPWTPPTLIQCMCTRSISLPQRIDCESEFFHQ